jgi:hypothetical protein
MADEGLPEGFDIRFARPEDNDELVRISRASAIRLGDVRLVVDPGDDYFAAFRLMEEWTAVVVTHHDKVVGVQCGCSFPGTFGPDAEPARISQVIHTRFDPDYTRMGLCSHLNNRMLAAGRERAASFERGDARAMASEEPLRDDGDGTPPPARLVGVAYVHGENDRMRRLYSPSSVWSDQPYRVSIACTGARAMAGGIDERPASCDDVASITAILNATHVGQELYAPYTPRTLTRRLERAPDLYSWRDVWMTDRAAVGVWHSPEVRIRTEADQPVLRSRRALVLDHGFLPGAEDEYESLIRGAAGRAGLAGYDHLSVFTSEASSTSKVLRRLADTIERYEVIVPFVQEPRGVAERGVYVDQAYF